MAECAPLIEAAHLNIYRENVFRITGLPVDATPKEIIRHADKLKMMEELGRGQDANTSAFALDPPPSLDAIREAMQRLKEPERRLIDEFCWFWPEAFGDSKSDPAIQAIMLGDCSAAYDIWVAKEQDSSVGHIATHNIAVLLHMVALDWTIYHLAADVDSQREEKITNYWREAFVRWEKVASDERIWDAVRARIRSLDDPRLTTGFARRMCDVLPEALDKINAEAALRFAEDRGRLDLARLHVDFMRETHRGLDDVEKTSELVLRPIRVRVKQHIQMAKDAAIKNPSTGADAAEELLEHCLPLSDLYELFHGKDAYQKTELFDEVALTSLECIISYQKKTGDNERCVDLLRFAMSLATAIDIRQRIQKNINLGEKNVRWKALDPLYALLRSIQESSNAARVRLVELKRNLMPHLAALAEQEGDHSDLVEELSNALAVVLRGISIDAHNDEEDFETALEAIRLASRLAKSADFRRRIDGDVAVLEKSFAESEASLVDLDIRGDKVLINRQVVRCNSQQIRVQDVTGVRFGIFVQYTNGVKSSVSYLIGIAGPGTNITIECKRFLRSEEQAQSDYKSILNGLFHHVLPKLATRIAKRIAAGSPYEMGGTKIAKEGIYLRTGMLIWEKEIWCLGRMSGLEFTRDRCASGRKPRRRFPQPWTSGTSSTP
jgi:hypothetical protein